jgi:Tfp pilus assembly protein PilN
MAFVNKRANMRAQGATVTYSPVTPPEERIAELEAENATLRAQIQELVAQNQQVRARLAKDSYSQRTRRHATPAPAAAPSSAPRIGTPSKHWLMLDL